MKFGLDFMSLQSTQNRTSPSFTIGNVKMVDERICKVGSTVASHTIKPCSDVWFYLISDFVKYRRLL
jgi:hypothetical protein